MKNAAEALRRLLAALAIGWTVAMIGLAVFEDPEAAIAAPLALLYFPAAWVLAAFDDSRR